MTEIATMKPASKESEPIRVLLVEDEFFISEWVTESLSEQGFAVHCETNAADALHHLASAPVDVLFTDINLPGGMDGTVLARCARELLPRLPVVYATACVHLEPQACVPGAAFVSKPYIPELVGRLIADAFKSAVACIPA